VQGRVGLCLVLLLAFAGIGLGSIPSATVPPSSYQGGLINTPNPIDNSANLPITGNVRGGKHFRGSIPYNSTTSFGAPLGSTSLDSFLRYSAVPEARANYPQNYSPYYSPSGTVTTTVPGYPGVFSPSSPRIAGGPGQFRTDQPVDTMAMAEVPQPQFSPGERSAGDSLGIGTSPRLRYWPMSPSAGEMKDIISDELGDRLSERPLSPTGDPLMTPDEYQQRLDQLRRNVERIQTGMPPLDRNPNADSAAAGMQPPLQQLPMTMQPGQTSPPVDGQLELYHPATGETTLTAPPREAGQTGEPSPQTDAAESGKLPALQRIEETARAFDATSRFFNRAPNEQPGAPDRLRSPSATEGARDVAEQGPPEALPAVPADGDRRTNGNATAVMQKQFDHYLAAAQLYMQQDRYYRAADSFTLASVYIPHDPRAHLGKGHALLAAGEYVSSAVSLARAIELDARYALGKVDLVEIIGGPDAFVQRITNLEERAQGSDASQLQFLLAYVYLQMDQLSEARIAIEAARNGLPSSVAADLLETALQGIAGK
jgi:tetratricopeptide (TPR) repeat protein